MQKKILVIDDEYDVASTMELALEMEDHEVRLSFHGKDALHILANEALPDLIISDVMMPVMDGYEFARELRSNKRFDHIPLILSSAANIDPSRLQGVPYQEFIRKPFDLSHFLDIVQKYIKP